jgi:eukaryotic-like serine/threonine-protein kinase
MAAKANSPTSNIRKTILKIVLLYLGIILFSWLFLRWYTDHGEFVTVPDLKGQLLSEAQQELSDRDLGYEIIDSIWDSEAVPGSVVEQSPAAESQVKEGRIIYLSVYRTSPPLEKLGVSEGEFATVAMIKLKNKGIRFDTIFEPNNNFVGSVIKVLHKGHLAKSESLIPRGDKVILYLGVGERRKVIVPDFTGMTCSEAKILLDSLNLMCNPIFDLPSGSIPNAQDSANFRVCSQDPLHDSSIGVMAGRIVDLYLFNGPCQPDSLH